MTASITRAPWLRRYGLASALFIVVVILWSTACGVGLRWMLGIRLMTVNNRPATFWDEVQIGTEFAPPAALLCILALVMLLLAGAAFRAWLMSTMLLLVGTPVTLFGGMPYVRWLWQGNPGFLPLESFVPPAAGVLAAWLAYGAATMWLARYRVVIVRRNDQRRSPCPRCGYDIFGSDTGVCAECGWQLPAARAADVPPPSA